MKEMVLSMVPRLMLNYLMSSEDNINVVHASWTSSYQLDLIFSTEQKKTRSKRKKKKKKKKNKEEILKFHPNHQPQPTNKERKIKKLSLLQNKLNKEKNKRLIVKRRKMVRNLKKLRKLLTKIKSIIIKEKKNASIPMNKRRSRLWKKWKKVIFFLFRIFKDRTS
jgi:hypothetical protein